MADILASIEQFGLVRALKTSFVAYPIVNALHIVAVGALFTSVMLMDLRIVGVIRSVPGGPLIALLRRTALVAFVGALITGSLLFSVRARDYATMPIFLIKMALVLVAGVNFITFLLVLRRQGDDVPIGTVTVVLAILSLVLWTCVLFAGRLIGFV